MIVLVSGVACGYAVSSLSFQNQVFGLQLQVNELQTNYAQLQSNYTILQNNFTTILTQNNQLLTQNNQLLANYTGLIIQYNQLQTNYTSLQTQYNELLANYTQLTTEDQVRIDQVTWGVANNNCTVQVRNTGSVAATIESISLRLSSTGSTFYSRTFTSGNSINTGSTIVLEWTESAASAPADFLQNLTEYVVRVTTSTGFQYEMVATTPSS